MGDQVFKQYYQTFCMYNFLQFQFIPEAKDSIDLDLQYVNLLQTLIKVLVVEISTRVPFGHPHNWTHIEV